MVKYIWRNIIAPIKRQPKHINKCLENLIDDENVCTEPIDVFEKTTKLRNCLNLLTILLGVILLASVAMNITFILKPSAFTKVNCQTEDTSDQVCLDCKYFNANGSSFLWKDVNVTTKYEGYTENSDTVCCFERAAFSQLSQTVSA